MSTTGHRPILLALSAAAALSACVVQERVYSPPPRPYYPPPPPAYSPPPAQVGADGEVQASEAPPPLPDYAQPPCPDEGYLWTPGYWHWGYGGYYWVPGTWVMPPQVGVLWTPGYWGFVSGVYVFNAGYWGPHVGFYGGVNYGFGYAGVGFAGGRWVGNRYAYNTAVNNVNVTNVHNTYNETVVNNVTVNKVSYNGGPAGTRAQPTVQEMQAARETHVPPTPIQAQHIQEARANPALSFHANGGHPAIAATPRAAAFNSPGVVGAHGAAPLLQRPVTAPQGTMHGNFGNGAPPPTAAPNAVRPLPSNTVLQPVNPRPPVQTLPPPGAKAPPPKPKAHPEEKRREPEGGK